MHVAFLYAPVLTLGPGKRVGLWLQGCSMHCPGCMSASMQPHAREAGFWMEPEKLGQEIVSRYNEHDCQGLTISGGEPFEQPEKLRSLLLLLRSDGITDILLYSGWQFEKIKKFFPWVTSLVSCLVDGPFIQAAPANAGWKGSENQNCFLFVGHQNYQDWLNSEKGRIQVINSYNHVRLIGIPRIDDVPLLLNPGVSNNGPS